MPGAHQKEPPDGGFFYASKLSLKIAVLSTDPPSFPSRVLDFVPTVEGRFVGEAFVDIDSCHFGSRGVGFGSNTEPSRTGFFNRDVRFGGLRGAGLGAGSSGAASGNGCRRRKNAWC